MIELGVGIRHGTVYITRNNILISIFDLLYVWEK
jgi:hypothetical protein